MRPFHREMIDVAPTARFQASFLTLLVMTGAASAAPMVPSPFPSALRESAEESEKRGDWSHATNVYQRLLASDQTRSTELRESLSRCARRAEQSRRLADPAYRKFADSLTLPQALAIYGEVLTRLQTLYFDRDKATIDRMYRSSLDELAAAVSSPAFPKGSDAFAPLLKAAALVKPSEVTTARDAIKTLALAGKRIGDMPIGLMILECAQGACAGLDDYTLYLYPGHDDESNANAPSVTTAEAVRDPAKPNQPVVGYLRIGHFGPGLPVELDGAMTRLRDSGAKAIVLDLRGVPGGSLQAAVQSAERFLTKGAIATARGQQQGANRIYAAPGSATCELPLVVLVDSGTASAAELLAAALKDRDRAVLIGQTTFGKGAVQQVIPLDAGGHLRLTLARLFGPDGKTFHDVGVTPTISEPRSERQLEIAMQEATKLAEKKAG